MMPFKTFLSSTYEDLVLHRRAVAEALERLGLHVQWMERFGARPEEPTTACLGEVSGCDLFLGLYAHRYGFVPAGGTKSITEAEFEHARLHNKPVFCYFIQENFAWPPNFIEKEPGQSKLMQFRQRISDQIVRDVFTTAEDLAAKVTGAIGRYLKDKAYPADGDHVTVERVIDANAPSVLPALNLFSRRIPEDERFPAEDIIRWLIEDQQQDKGSAIQSRECFLIARTQTRVCGFLLMHYYFRHRLAFLAYLVTEKEIRLERGKIAARILEYMSQLLEHDDELKECEEFMLEVDDPRHATTERIRRHRTARIELFCAIAQARGFKLRALDINYRQPLLHIPEPGDRGREQPMLLMYASKKVAPELPVDKVVQLLRFVYLELYPNGFSTIPKENELYCAYLEDFCAKQIARLPLKVRLLGSHAIRRGLNGNKPEPSSGNGKVG